MTIKLLRAWNGFAVGTILNNGDGATEAALVANGTATFNVSTLGGAAYQANTVNTPNVVPGFDPVTGQLASSLLSTITPYIGQVATHCFQPLTFSAGNVQQMSRSYHVAQVDLAVIQLVFPNWYGAELAPGGAATITASVEYPVGVFTQVKFAGVAQGSIPNGRNLASDLTNVQIPAGAAFFVRSYCTNALGGVTTGYLNQTVQALGEAFNVGASGVVDQTMGGTITQVAPGNLYGPIAILGLTTKPSVLIIGDSRSAGQDESAAGGSAGTTEVGQITRSLFPSIGFINCSNPGERAQLVAATNTLRCGLSQFVTHVICQLGVNDVGNSRTAAQALTDIQTIRAACQGRKFYQATILPVSSSTNSWATVAAQTTASYNAQRVTLNNLIRANPTGFSGYLETADPVESSRDSGLWKAPAYTVDGVHGSTAGYQLIQNARVIDPALILR